MTKLKQKLTVQNLTTNSSLTVKHIKRTPSGVLFFCSKLNELSKKRKNIVEFYNFLCYDGLKSNIEELDSITDMYCLYVRKRGHSIEK